MSAKQIIGVRSLSGVLLVENLVTGEHYYNLTLSKDQIANKVLIHVPTSSVLLNLYIPSSQRQATFVYGMDGRLKFSGELYNTDLSSDRYVYGKNRSGQNVRLDMRDMKLSIINDNRNIFAVSPSDIIFIKSDDDSIYIYDNGKLLTTIENPNLVPTHIMCDDKYFFYSTKALNYSFMYDIKRNKSSQLENSYPIVLMPNNMGYISIEGSRMYIYSEGRKYPINISNILEDPTTLYKGSYSVVQITNDKMMIVLSPSDIRLVTFPANQTYLDIAVI